MKRIVAILAIVLACVLLLGELSAAPLTADAETMTNAEFIQLVGNLAVNDYPNSRILPSVVIAQAILETGWGSSEIMMRYNALYGVKATSSWNGACFSAKTGEYYGAWTSTTALFRAYPSLEACLADHTRVLSNSRYSGVIGGTDYVTVCNLLQSGGYATDPYYASKLINTINARELYRYDNQVLSNLPTPGKSGYDASAAVAYARQWSQTGVAKRNSAYSSYAGADCANFVSQCLAAGGLATDKTWFKDSTTWIRANDLRKYLLSLGYSGRDYSANGGSKLDLTGLSPGDIVWCVGASGTYGHVMIVSEVTATGYKICGHTKEQCDVTYTNYNKMTYHIKMNGTTPIVVPVTLPPYNEEVETKDYVVHIDHPSGTYDGTNGVEISGWVASKIRLTSVMAQSTAIVGGQMNLTEGAVDASEELNEAGYGAFAYKYRFRGVIPPDGLAANTTYSFSVWMDLATGGQTKVTTSSFRVGSLNSGGAPAPTPTADPHRDLLDCIVHIDKPTGTYTNTDVEISGWIASLKPIGACMVESEAIPTRQYNLTSSLKDASSELNGAGYGAYPYKYRYSGAIPKVGMKSDTDYEFKVWFNFTDGTSSGVTTSTFHAAEMKNTRIVITSPKGGSNYANNANVTISGYILANSPLWYIMGEAGSNQYSFEGTNDATLAANNGYAYAYRFSKTIRCDSLPANSNPTLKIWTKTSADDNVTLESVKFTTGARVYGDINSFVTHLDSPGNGVTLTKDQEVTGWIAAHAPIAYVMYQGVPTDGTGGFQISCNIEPTSELDSGYSGYEYRARFRGIIEYGSLKSNKTYDVTVWCGLVNSSGSGEQKFIDGCGRTFKTGTVTKPVYTNTFNANGGTGAPAAISKTWGTAITLPATVPTRLGYTFLGWSFNKDSGEKQYSPRATFREETDHTFYAVWEKAKLIPVDSTVATESVLIAFGGQKRAFTLTPNTTTKYKFNVESQLEVAVYNSNGTLFKKGTGIEVYLTGGNTYYVSTGYLDDTRTGTYTLTIRQGYPVVFDANGGTGAPADTYYQYYNQAMDLPTQEPTKNVSLTLNANGGTLASATRTLSADFQGWTADEGASTDTVFNQATVLSAEWAYPEIGQLETPVREGYELRCWVDDELNPVDPTYVVDSDMTLTAIWALKEYAIAYDLNGGEGEIEATVKLHGENASLTASVPTREGYDFAGWAISAGAEEPDYPAGGVFTTDADTTLYAIWTLSRVPVTAFSLTEQEFSLHVGGTHQIAVTAEPEGADLSSISWESLKPAVAIVDENGLVTGVSEGTAMIKATCADTGTTIYVRALVTARLTVTLPAGLTAIEAEAFMGDESIAVVNVGDEVLSIGSAAFKNCVNLEEIRIPATVTDIALDAFDGCGKLTIYCAEDSAAWEVALLKSIPFVTE